MLEVVQLWGFCRQCPKNDTELLHNFACNLDLGGISKGISEREGVTLISCMKACVRDKSTVCQSKINALERKIKFSRVGNHRLDQREHTPVYEKRTKRKQNDIVETTKYYRKVDRDIILMSQLSVIDGMLSAKNPNLYYYSRKKQSNFRNVVKML